MKNKIVEKIEVVSKLRKHISELQPIDPDDLLAAFEKEEQIDALLASLENEERVEKINLLLRSRKSGIADASKLKGTLDRMVRQKQMKRRLVWFGSSAVAAVFVLCFVLLLIPKVENVNINLVQTHKGVAEAQEIRSPMIITQDGEQINLTQLSGSHTKSDYTITRDSNKILYTNQHAASEVINKLLVPSGHRYTIVLEDGSEVTVNAGSELRYPVSFNDSIRCVTFHGEAFFKIAKSSKPFIVNINNVYVRVYGTEFNINTQRNNLIEAVLVEGSVGFGTKGAKDEVKMHPNQLVCYDLLSGKKNIEEVDVADYISWKEDTFLYRERELGTVLSDLSVWYGLEFEHTDAVGSLNVTLRMSRKTELTEMLKMIEIATGVRFVKQNQIRYNVEKMN